MKQLLTCSGKYGDCLWCLPTARFIASNIIKEPVYFAVLDNFSAILPLIRQQPYIANALLIPEWKANDSDNEPWRIPAPRHVPGFDAVLHLSYNRLPDIPLIDFIAAQQGYKLEHPLPFITQETETSDGLVAFAFNEMHEHIKAQFLHRVMDRMPRSTTFVNVSEIPFEEAARVIASAKAFLGCRSANYVIAQGLKKTIVTFEPEDARRSPVFGCPYGFETIVDNANDAVDALTKVVYSTESDD